MPRVRRRGQRGLAQPPLVNTDVVYQVMVFSDGDEVFNSLNRSERGAQDSLTTEVINIYGSAQWQSFMGSFFYDPLADPISKLYRFYDYLRAEYVIPPLREGETRNQSGYYFETMARSVWR